MDGDGFLLYLSLLLVAFGLGSIFMLLFVHFENKKPEITREEVEKDIKDEIKSMTLLQFYNWIKN